MFAEPLDLARAGITGTTDGSVRGPQLVAEQERSLRPHQDFSDPAPAAASPPRAQARNFSLRDPDCPAEGARLAADPQPPGEYDREDGDYHDQIDAQHYEQR